jgi:predicted ATP-binding protein involved in virulence
VIKKETQMQLRRVEIIKYRNFENIVIDFEKSDFPNVFSIASKNGGGKSTLLQFIFIMLHCFMSEDKKKYIQKLLHVFSDTTEELELVKFIIEENHKVYKLEFSIINTQSKYGDFNLYLDSIYTQSRIHKYKRDIEKYEKILILKEELDETNRITPLIERNLRSIGRLVKTQREEDLYRGARKTDDIDKYKSLLESMISRKASLYNNIDELESINDEIQNNISHLESSLDKDNLFYITHLIEEKNVVLLKTAMPQKLLVDLSKKVFLTAPSSQIFLFLSDAEKQDIFSEFNNSSSSYYDNVEEAKEGLDNFFTYDFASTELILKSFQKASDEDLKEKRKTGHYGIKYDELRNELKDFLDKKEITENEEGNKVIFKSKGTKEELAPEDLSHGELKKLGIYIWLKYIVEEDSIVLMDEVDIALHPKWQYELIKDLTCWSKDSQFLLATHSPQIIGSTYYKNIIKLDNGVVKRFAKPPVDRDINTIITEIMEAEDFPIELLILHKQYRKMINDDKVETVDAKKLKEEILEYESENSSFFQEINFDLELM